MVRDWRYWLGVEGRGEGGERRRWLRGIGSVLLSRGNSPEGHRSPRSSAGANRALPAWLRFGGAQELCLLSCRFRSCRFLVCIV